MPEMLTGVGVGVGVGAGVGVGLGVRLGVAPGQLRRVSGRKLLRASVSEFVLTSARLFTRPKRLHQITAVAERVPG